MKRKKLTSPILIKYRAVYDKNPRSKVFAPLAEAYRKLGLNDEAIKILKAGLKHHPDYILGLITLGQCYYDQGQFSICYHTLRPYMEKNIENYLLQKLFAQTCLQLERWEEALASFKCLLFMRPREKWIQEQVLDLEEREDLREKLVLSPQKASLAERNDPRPSKNESTFAVDLLESLGPGKMEDQWVEVSFQEENRKLDMGLDSEGQEGTESWVIHHSSPGKANLKTHVPPLQERDVDRGIKEERENREDKEDTEELIATSQLDLEAPTQETPGPLKAILGAGESSPLTAAKELRSIRSPATLDPTASSNGEEELSQDWQEAEGEVEEVEGPRKDPVVTHTLVDLYCAQGYYHKGIEVLEKILALNPNDGRTLVRLAQLREFLGKNFSYNPASNPASLDKEGTVEKSRTRILEEWGPHLEGPAPHASEGGPLPRLQPTDGQLQKLDPAAAHAQSQYQTIERVYQTFLQKVQERARESFPYRRP